MERRTFLKGRFSRLSITSVSMAPVGRETVAGLITCHSPTRPVDADWPDFHTMVSGIADDLLHKRHRESDTLRSCWRT